MEPVKYPKCTFLLKDNEPQSQPWYFQDIVLKGVFSFSVVCIESLYRVVGDGVNNGLVLTKTSWRTMECCDLRFNISEVRKYHS